MTTAVIRSGINGTLDRFRLDLGRYPTTEEGLAVLLVPPEDEELACKQNTHFSPRSGAMT
ncbi:MAG: type II secretion system protein GspG [Planctomycetes bacterium]|nr:type II secretion system protein GspG [Planctomycetota bacterium]